MTASTRGVVELDRHIAARPEIVFSYFTDPERYRKWQGVDAELDPRPGGIFRVTMTGRTGVVVRGQYLEVDPPRRLVYTWGWEQVDGMPEGMRLEPGTSTVEIDLVPDGDGTLLHMRHRGLPSTDACQFHLEGWSLTLDRLVIAAAGGDPGPSPLDEQ